MARKNRKRRRQARVMSVPFIGIVVLVASLLICYLGIDIACGELGQEIRRLEAEHEGLEAEYLRALNAWTAMKAPGQIEQALQRHGLNMALPRGDQVVRIGPPFSGGEYRPRDQYAGRR